MSKTPLCGGITRRDFINGMLVAAGGMVLGGFSPRHAFGESPVGRHAGDGGIGTDPRALRGGNIPSLFNVGHWLRDERLTFGATSVHVAPAPYDNVSGTFPIHEDTGDYEVIVAGSGLSGLSAAFFLQRYRPNTRVLLLDANALFGGNAGRDDAPPIPVIASTAGAYAVVPYADFLFEIYDTVGIDWQSRIIQPPFYSYFFDEHTPYVRPGTRGWNLDTYGSGLPDVPYPQHVVRDLHKARQDFRNWYNRSGAPTDPADGGHPRFDYLAHKSLDDYLTGELGVHPAVSDFYTRYSVDALGGTSRQVNAYTSISFLGAEYSPLFTYPGGTSGLARHVLKWLIPGSIQGGATSDEIIAGALLPQGFDLADQAVRLRQAAMVLRVDNSAQKAKVIYFRDGKFWRARAGAAVLAGQGYTAQHLVGHLLTNQAREAWRDITVAPAVTANVTLRRAAPLVELGLGLNQYYWGSQHWADYLVADWVTPQNADPNRETVLTFYGAGERPPEEMPQERVKLLTTPFAEYEQSLREDLNRTLAGAGFDFDRDVSAVYVYRWGHAVVYPKLGYVFGRPVGDNNGNMRRTPAPRHLARTPLGRVSFAGQDVEGSPAVESALGSGQRVAEEVLTHL